MNLPLAASICYDKVMLTFFSLRGLSIASPLLAMTLLLPRIGHSQAA